MKTRRPGGMTAYMTTSNRLIFAQPSKTAIAALWNRFSPAWLANVLLIGASLLISVAPAAATRPTAFCAFLIGHFCLSVRAHALRDWNNLLLNASMLLLDTYAIIVRM